MVVNGLHFVRRNERTWHHRFPDQRSPFRAGRVSSSAEGLRTRVSRHAAQDQPKWPHECQRTRKNERYNPFGNFFRLYRVQQPVEIGDPRRSCTTATPISSSISTVMSLMPSIG